MDDLSPFVLYDRSSGLHFSRATHAWQIGCHRWSKPAGDRPRERHLLRGVTYSYNTVSVTGHPRLETGMDIMNRETSFHSSDTLVVVDGSRRRRQLLIAGGIAAALLILVLV